MSYKCKLDTRAPPSNSVHMPIRVLTTTYVQGDFAGPGGLTPFHLAVFLPQPQSISLLLSATLGARHWFSCTTHDGKTPADFALRCGKSSLNHAISVSMCSQAHAGEDLRIQDRPAAGEGCTSRQQFSWSTTSGWSDSSTSSDDDSHLHLDAAQPDDTELPVLSSTPFAVSSGFSAAADFVRHKKERLAAILREHGWFTTGQ